MARWCCTSQPPRADYQRRVRDELLAQPLHSRQLGRPAAVQQLGHLLAVEPPRAQAGPPELAGDQVAPGLQPPRHGARDGLGIIRTLAAPAGRCPSEDAVQARLDLVALEGGVACFGTGRRHTLWDCWT